ncbi:MAG: hypothetical protein HY301_11550 [Verrucomicrobia bacterium]|nr:hypothetical protein [Verrucomicrobiota bacterium]
MKLKLLALTVLLAWLAPARAADAPPAANGHRFLFLVDASTNLARCHEATVQTVNELLLSAMNGEMRTGDSFAIWPFRAKVFTETFPPESWVVDLKDDHAANARQFVERLKFEGRTGIGAALVELAKGVAASRSVTVFLVTDGSEPVTGTPFDLYVNTIFRDQAAELRKSRKPFVTAFLAVDGKIIDCLVSTGGEKVQVPRIPADARPKAAPAPAPVAAVVKPNAPAPLILTKPKPEPVPAPVEPPAPAPKPTVAATPTEPAVPKSDPPATEPAKSGTPTPPMSLGKLDVEPPKPKASPPPVTAPAPAAQTPAPVAITPPPTAAPATAQVTTTAVAAATKPGLPAVLAGFLPESKPLLSRTMLLAIGVLLIVMATVICWFMVRAARPAKGPSLISRSMER